MHTIGHQDLSYGPFVYSSEKRVIRNASATELLSFTFFPRFYLKARALGQQIMEGENASRKELLILT